MAWHLYTSPIIIVTKQDEDFRAPKYISALPVSWTMIDYGFQPTCLVAADLSAAQDSSVAGQPEVIAVPDNLDLAVGGNPVLSGLKTKLEANFTPASWILATTPYRQVARQIVSESRLLQRYRGITLDLTAPFAGFTLDSTFSQLSASVQSGLIAAATELGFTTTLFVGASTLRTVLRDIGVQDQNRVTTMGGIQI